jgi:pimeloyl-ACP methyl ester carboxylesterase
VKPSWALVADADKIINPDLERFYAARPHSHVVVVKGAGHSVYESRPKEVAALIEKAAQPKIGIDRHERSTHSVIAAR